MSKSFLDSVGLRVLWNQIKAQDESMVVYGYYLNGSFYTDSTYTEELLPEEHKIYIDINRNPERGDYGFVYVYTSSDFSYHTISIPEANREIKGIMKLYDETGINTDGTMTQKSITTALNDKVYIDDEDEETLVITMF